MIEQTDLVVTKWEYHPPATQNGEEEISQITSFDVMKKRAADKKGLACRFSCCFKTDTQALLVYIGEDSYVIDLEDKINDKELLKMIRNSYSKFKDTFDLRKLGTILENRTLSVLDEAGIDLDAILPLLD